MQTILGAGGAIGTELVRELARTRQQVRLVGRNPKLVAGATEVVSADISNLDQTIRAVAGSNVVFEPTSSEKGIERTALAYKSPSV